MKPEMLVVIICLFATAQIMIVAGNENDESLSKLKNLYLFKNKNFDWIKEDSVLDGTIKPLYKFIMKDVSDEWDEWIKPFKHNSNVEKLGENIFKKTKLTHVKEEIFQCASDLYETSWNYRHYNQNNSTTYEKLILAYEKFLTCPNSWTILPYFKNWIHPIYHNIIEFLVHGESELIDDKNVEINRNIIRAYERIMESSNGKHYLQPIERKLINESPEKFGHFHYIERIIEQVYDKLYQKLSDSGNPLYDRYLKDLGDTEIRIDSSNNIENNFKLLFNSIDKKGLSWKHLDDNIQRNCLARLYGQSYLNCYDDYANSSLMKIYLFDEFENFIRKCPLSEIAHIEIIKSFIQLFFRSNRRTIVQV